MIRTTPSSVHFSIAHSLGLGNIHLARAKLVSPDYIPPAGSDAALAARLEDPAWNILYVAAILRQDADRPNRYPGYTTLTDDQMAILATEYQIGLRDSPAASARPNAYGQEVEIQVQHFRQISFVI